MEMAYFVYLWNTVSLICTSNTPIYYNKLSPNKTPAED